jgi:hypothetical protein
VSCPAKANRPKRSLLSSAAASAPFGESFGDWKLNVETILRKRTRNPLDAILAATGFMLPASSRSYR